VKTSYLAGTTAARTGDELSGPAVLLLGFAVTGTAVAGSVLLACLTGAAATGGLMFGTLLDRSRRPERLLAGALAAYAAGIAALAAAIGRLPLPAVVPVALVAGLFLPAVAGGWTSQLPRMVTPAQLPRASALDALTYDAGALAGPALAALIAASLGARIAVCAAATLVGITVPVALTVLRTPSVAAEAPPAPGAPPAVTASKVTASAVTASAVTAPERDTPLRQLAAGLAAIAGRRALLRATVTSAVSYIGIGMLLVCCPLLGRDRLGGEAHGALLIAADAAAGLAANALLARRSWRRPADIRVFASTLFMGAGIAGIAVTPGWLTMIPAMVVGAGGGPQLTALFEVRHREAPEGMRGQIFTTAASLKIAGYAAGTALGGWLAGWSVTGCLLIAAGIEVAAAAVYLVNGQRRARREPQAVLIK
jgi:MFS family permease